MFGFFRPDVDKCQPHILFYVSAADPEHQERFEHWLCEVNSSDGISLLTSLAQMATATQLSDPAFITTITLLIYQVCQGQADEKILKEVCVQMD